MWTTVATDPANFSIVLVDHSSAGPQQTTISPVLKTAGPNFFAFSNIVAPPGDKYQINFIGTDPSNTGIIAQSQYFTVTKSGGDSTSSSPSTTTSPTGTGSGSPTPSKPNGAATLAQTFGVAIPVIAALYMLI